MDWKTLQKFKRLDNTPHGLTGYEDPIWYDGIFCYKDNDGNIYSRAGNPMEENEMCKPGVIYKVIPHKEGPGRFDYSYQIVGARPDTIWQCGGWKNVTLETIKWNRAHKDYADLLNENCHNG